MAKQKTGAGGGRQPDDNGPADQRQNVNERSLLILRLVWRLTRTYPAETDVTGVVDQLSVEDERAWAWICDLGLVQGDPASASLTAFGKQVVEKASMAAGFTEILEGSDRLREPEDKHASGMLALLHASFELGGTQED